MAKLTCWLFLDPGNHPVLENDGRLSPTIWWTMLYYVLTV